MKITLEKIALLGSIRSLGAGAAGRLKDIALWDPALGSTVLGAGIGALASGEDRRIRGAALGGLGGLTGGMVGAGLLGGLAKSGIPRSWVVDIFGNSPLTHQYVLGGLGGLIGGTMLQPDPIPIIMRNRMTEGAADIGSTIDKAKELVSGVGAPERV